VTARWRARRLAAAAALLVLVASAAYAARGPEPRVRRLHLPPPPETPLAVPGPTDPSVPPVAGGSPSAPPPPGAPAPPPPPLPRVAAVDESEWAIQVSRTVVGAGDVTFNVYNRGEDDHDLAVVDADGTLRTIDVPSRETRSLVVRLAPGQVKLYCSLFAGTPASHEAAGMSTLVEVR
jgi:hypothetical protein